MATLEQKKEFALLQLAPYFADPSTCGYDEDKQICEYLTKDNKMCVAGKNMLDPNNPRYINMSIDDILIGQDQDEIFKPEVVGILTDDEWCNMQKIHDNIATNYPVRLAISIKKLNLFTIEELQERANLLKKDLAD